MVQHQDGLTWDSFLNNPLLIQVESQWETHKLQIPEVDDQNHGQDQRRMVGSCSSVESHTSLALAVHRPACLTTLQISRRENFKLHKWRFQITIRRNHLKSTWIKCWHHQLKWQSHRKFPYQTHCSYILQEQWSPATFIMDVIAFITPRSESIRKDGKLFRAIHIQA